MASAASSVPGPSSTTTRGCNVTSVNWPSPPDSTRMVPVASSTYSRTTTPAAAARWRNHSMWHCDRLARNSSSGLYRVGSPRNAGSAEPGSGGLPSRSTSWSRV
ncbi:hypothetical protein IU11_15340 [Cellulosimicrobium sp. MM]|nr:hypothetical protein IU11_15340 [Cellulosimicrobium sp. MM]